MMRVVPPAGGWSVPMKLRSSCLVVWLIAALAAPAFAEEASVEAFVAEVLEKNPSLRARTLVRDAARREASAAGIYSDPEVAVMFDQYPQHSEESEPPMIRYQVSQMLHWPGKLGLMEAVAERRTDAVEADAKTQALDLIRDAKRSYWMLLMNKGLRDVNAAGRGLLDTIAGAALARYGAGTGGHHETMRAQVEQSANEVEAIDLEGDRMATLAMLNALRNAPAQAQLAEPREPAQGTTRSTPPLSQLEKIAFSRRPELARMRAMQREEATMASMARRERYPDLMTSIWYNQMLGMPDNYGVMVGARVPLFNIGRQNRLAEASELRAGSAGSELLAMQNMIRFEIADASRKLVTAERTLALILELAAPRANESFASSLAGYATGSVEIVGVLDAWRALQSIERARVEAVANRLMAIADLERAIGGALNEVSR